MRQLPTPSIVGEHTVLDTAFYQANCAPQFHTRGQLTWDGLAVCIRCLSVHDSKKKVTQDLVLDHWAWFCKDRRACDKQITDLRENHRREIQHRIRRQAGEYTHLVVVQCIFGHKFGYGNMYILVRHDESVADVVSRRCNHQNLVVETVIQLPVFGELEVLF